MTEMTGKLIAGFSPSPKGGGDNRETLCNSFSYSPKKTLSLLDDEF